MSVFMILLIIGLSFPAVSLLFSLIFGSIEGLLHMLHFEIGSGDTHHDVSKGGGHLGLLTAFLPLSPIVWCVLLAVTGCVGEMLSRADSMNIAAIWLIAGIAGYTTMLIVNNCVMLPLKRVKNYADSTDDMIGMQVEVIQTILEDGVGAVRVAGKSGASIFAAKAEGGIRINQGETVTILEIADGRATVSRQIR